MQNGDLSNELSPRMLVVIEPLVAHPQPMLVKNYNLARRLHRYKQALGCLYFEPLAMSYLKDLSWRQHIRVDGVTFEGPGMADAFQDFFDAHNIGVGYTTHYDSPDTLGRAMAYMPEVLRVLHGDERIQMAVGTRGYNGTGPAINRAMY